MKLAIITLLRLDKNTINSGFRLVH